MRIHSKPILYVHLGYYIGDVPSFSIQNAVFHKSHTKILPMDSFLKWNYRPLVRNFSEKRSPLQVFTCDVGEFSEEIFYRGHSYNCFCMKRKVK